MSRHAEGERGSDDALIRTVHSVRGVLRRVLWGRIGLQAVGCGLALWWLTTHAVAVISSDGWVLRTLPMYMAVLVSAALGVVLHRRWGAITAVRTALWIEEQQSAGHALVTWVEQASARPAVSPWVQERVEQASHDALAAARAALGPFARVQLVGPGLFAFGTAMLLAWSMVSTSNGVGHWSIGSIATPVTAPSASAAVGPWSVRTTPPRYTRRASEVLGNVSSLTALSGTQVEVLGRGAAPDSVTARMLADSALAVRAVARSEVAQRWLSQIVVADGPMEVRVFRGPSIRLLLIDGVRDSLPRVTLDAPARDSVLRSADGRIALVARLHDDVGLARGVFEVVVSSGEGERFTVRTVLVGERAFVENVGNAAAVVTDTVLRTTLDLRALALVAGDVVHMRAVARDGHPRADRERGVSETRSFRVARASEYDSVAVEPAPPPEVDKSLLSQRMLLMLTERLEKRRPTIAAAVLHNESRTLARDQGRLRQAVGDAVFQRLTGDAGAEHSHFAGDGHEHGVEAVGGKLALSGVNAQGMLAEGDDAPVIAINKPLLEAYNAMWDAGRALEQSELRGAIPFMRIALDAIERARAAQRLYLRGRPPTVIIDLAKVRLVGKDTGQPGTRLTRPALPPTMQAREARLLRAAAQVERDPLAARDSLAILRLESLADQPMFAGALALVMDAINTSMDSGAGVDITAPFLRARQLLGGVERVPLSTWSRGGPP